MHLPSFNDLVFVLSLGTVIVSASPIVGRREAQLLGYMHPRESDGPKFQELKRIVSSTSSPVTSTIISHLMLIKRWTDQMLTGML
ncbi:hypothetical protein LENED_003119 [Lentinula edodes]|uniref:Uncharacterized protein n=1 Tax=Lentinula edodes TaxID=5353 RepID=A0A1Q3E2N4_LENED|nr:hypothetical protein LENED_003119 [Lentinula edodes]